MKEKITFKTTSVQKDFKKITDELLSGYFRPMSEGGPFSDLGALIALLDMCTHANHEVIGGKNSGVYMRGNTRTSLADLAENWDWSRNKVSKFLSKLERIGVIRLEPATSGTVIYLEFSE